jgi:hypothetical protein
VGQPARHSAPPSPPSTVGETQVDKAQIIEVLRSRGLHERADWVDRELPGVIDTHTNSSLLRMLQIDPAEIAPTGT